MVNPPDLSAADIIVAFRDGVWDGWICREWKSGVKVVNAIAAGRPLISQDSAAVRELGPVGTVVEGPADLVRALDFWTPASTRAIATDQASADLNLAAVAETYRQILAERGLACSA